MLKRVQVAEKAKRRVYTIAKRHTKRYKVAGRTIGKRSASDRQAVGKRFTPASGQPAALLDVLLCVFVHGSGRACCVRGGIKE